MTIIHDIKDIIISSGPFENKEEEHVHFTKEWIGSGVVIFRIAKPANPDPHLVVYAQMRLLSL